MTEPTDPLNDLAIPEPDFDPTILKRHLSLAADHGRMIRAILTLLPSRKGGAKTIQPVYQRRLDEAVGSLLHELGVLSRLL